MCQCLCVCVCENEIDHINMSVVSAHGQHNIATFNKRHCLSLYNVLWPCLYRALSGRSIELHNDWLVWCRGVPVF